MALLLRGVPSESYMALGFDVPFTSLPARFCRPEQSIDSESLGRRSLILSKMKIQINPLINESFVV